MLVCFIIKILELRSAAKFLFSLFYNLCCRCLLLMFMFLNKTNLLQFVSRFICVTAFQNLCNINCYFRNNYQQSKKVYLWKLSPEWVPTVKIHEILTGSHCLEHQFIIDLEDHGTERKTDLTKTVAGIKENLPERYHDISLIFFKIQNIKMMF